MKTMKNFLSMAALAVVGAVMTGCSSEDNLAGEPQTAKQDNIVTVTTTIGLGDDNAATRALEIDYTNKKVTKFFTTGDKVALVYENESSETKKAEATAENISADKKSATFTFELSNPKGNQTVNYYYPASLVNEAGSEVLTPIYSQNGKQDGNESIESIDYAKGSGTFSGTELPASVELKNQLAIVAFTLKDCKSTDDTTDDVDITSTITGMTISDGTSIYSITRSADEGPIYVIMRPTSEQTINITATSGAKYYKKTLTSKTYAKNNFYQQGLLMAEVTQKDLSGLTGNYTAQNGDVLTGTLGGSYKISIADGAIVTLNGVTINGTSNESYKWAGITCEGDAVIKLEGTNSVKGFYENYPGIYVPEGKTVTIQGEGLLDASSNGYGAGIGGGFNIPCGNIAIAGGIITARGGNGAAGIGGGNDKACGNITITGGTVTADGQQGGAGIGCGGSSNTGDTNATCGNITIANTVTKVTATAGSGAPNSIGKGDNGGTCGTVTIGGTVYWDGSAYQNGGGTYLTQNQIVYQPQP